MAEPDDDVPGVPEWVVTYGDMMSLLLTFFIMLVSMSELKEDDGKTRAMFNAIKRAFGPTKGTFGVAGTSTQQNSTMGKIASRGSQRKGGTERGSRDSKGPGGAHKSADRINNGTQVVLGGPARFARFQATLTPELKRNLDIIARVLRPKANQIVVRGHASPEPLPTDAEMASSAVGIAPPWPQTQTRRFLTSQGLEIRSPMDLSFARAKAVADYLISKKIAPRRLHVTAAGHSEQYVRTRRRSNQSRNRRVDVYLIDSYIAYPKPAR